MSTYTFVRPPSFVGLEPRVLKSARFDAHGPSVILEERSVAHFSVPSSNPTGLETRPSAESHDRSPIVIRAF
jgi:hypothetical protein